MPLTPLDLAASLNGLLAFPVTPFDPAGAVDHRRFQDHLTDVLKAKPSALFICCGTGEFPSLTFAEHAELVHVAVQHVGGEAPVLAGVGGGTNLAAEYARSAERAGADGVLALPPYLLAGPPGGLVEHYRQLASATDLGVVLYQRGTAIFSPEAVAELAELTNVVAFKDGHGDIELLQFIAAATADQQLVLLNGMPTAEIFARAYAGVGASSYSSAVLSFAPEIATAFYAALEQGDVSVQQHLLREFFVPLAQLRSTTKGYAISLVKAGLAVRGQSAGPVRPPLLEATPEHVEQLARLIDRGLAAVALASVA